MAGVPIQRANLKLWPEKGLSHTDQTAVSSWTQQIRWEAGWCATYLPRGAILIETFNKVLSKDSGSHRFYFWPIICFNTSRMRVYFMFEVVSSVVVKDAIWRKGPGLILRPNPGCTSVIHGRIWSQKDSRSLIPENRFFGWNFYPMKMMNSMSFLTCTPDSFPGMTELHAGYDSYLYQDTPSCSNCGQSLWNNSNSFGTNSECWFCHSFLTLTTPYEQLSKDDQVFRK